jgi:L-cysteine/cystine lyase
MDVQAIRKQVPATQQMVYLNTGWSGPSPVSVVEAITRFVEEEAYQGPTTPAVQEKARAVKLQAREAVAGLINATADEVILTQNTTHGLNIVLAGLPWKPDDEVITFDLEHGSVLLPALNLQRRHGVTTKVLPLAPDEDHDSIVKKVEAAVTDRTRMVFMSHVQYATGLRMPAERIRRLTKPRGVWMLLDGAQTPGHIALDMRALDVEFYAMPGQKWLLGPDGIGALYIRKDAIPLVEPVHVGGSAFPHHEEHDGLVMATDVITKFNLSSSSAPYAAGLAAGVAFIQQAGKNEIEERNRGLGTLAKKRLADIPGVTVHSSLAPEAATGLVTFGVAGAEPEAAVKTLWERHRIMARQVRNPKGIRLSLDFFNTEEELEQVLSAVERLASGR